jgi:hypothetical protein
MVLPSHILFELMITASDAIVSTGPGRAEHRATWDGQQVVLSFRPMKAYQYLGLLFA